MSIVHLKGKFQFLHLSLGQVSVVEITKAVYISLSQKGQYFIKFVFFILLIRALFAVGFCCFDDFAGNNWTDTMTASRTTTLLPYKAYWKIRLANVRVCTHFLTILFKIRNKISSRAFMRFRFEFFKRCGLLWEAFLFMLSVKYI